MDVIDRLGHPWDVVFGEAWTSWQEGNFGIGAAIVDPDSGEVVSVGRNRVGESPTEPGILSGNFLAHAEMNAFAALSRWNAEGLDVYTTLEPCLMCIASAMHMKVAAVHFAAEDEFFVRLDELWQHHPLTHERLPSSSGPLEGAMGRLARLLPLTYTFQHFAGRTAERLARERYPMVSGVVDQLLADPAELAEIRAMSMADGLGVLTSRVDW